MRPQLARYKTYEEAASAVDELFNSVFAHDASGKSGDLLYSIGSNSLRHLGDDGDDSGEESGEEDVERREEEEEEDGGSVQEESVSNRISKYSRTIVFNLIDG